MKRQSFILCCLIFLPNSSFINTGKPTARDFPDKLAGNRRKFYIMGIYRRDENQRRSTFTCRMVYTGLGLRYVIYILSLYLRSRNLQLHSFTVW